MLSDSAKFDSLSAGPRRLDEMPLRRFHLLVLFATSGGQFCDGYVLGTVGAALPGISQSMQCDEIWAGAIGSASLAGLFLGCLLIGHLTDRLGRRILLRLNMPIFLLLSLLQMAATSPLQLVIVRVLLGACLSTDYIAGAAYLSEFAPLRLRGRFLALMIIGWFAGYTLSNIAGMTLTLHSPDGWRLCLGSSALPGLAVLLLRLFLPESPRWLMTQYRPREAQEVLNRCFPGEAVFVAPPTVGLAQNWRTVFSPPWRIRLIVGTGFYAAQIVPYFCIGTFLPELLAALGIDDVYLGGIMFNVFLMAGSVSALWLIDRLPRRTFLIGSFAVTSVLLFGVAMSAYFPVTMTLTLFGFFALILSGATTLEMVYLPELFPVSLRGAGLGIATATSRLASVAGTFALPLLMHHIGTPATLGVCALILAGGGLLCAGWAPETRHEVW